MDIVTPFWKFYGLEYDQYKWTMLTSRFFHYIEYMNETHKNMNQSKHQQKVNQLKDTLTEEDMKELYGK